MIKYPLIIESFEKAFNADEVVEIIFQVYGGLIVFNEQDVAISSIMLLS